MRSTDRKEHRRLRRIAETLTENLFENPDDMRPIAAHLGEHAGAEGAQARSPSDRLDEQRSRVGIWEARGPNTFIRSTAWTHEWALWAQTVKIERFPREKCIPLIGESVARGYLYDPVYTPARVLQGILNHAPEIGPTRIVDLARTDLDAEGMLRLLADSRALRPDAVVVFAGNNWFGQGRPSTPSQYRAASAALAEDGLPGVIACLHQNLAAAVERYVSAIEHYAAELAVPVVLVIPEFNLADWLPAEETIGSWLIGAQWTAWSALRVEASRALAQDDYSSAEQLAKRMLEIDQRTLPAGLSILSICVRARGGAGLRPLLEELRDCGIWRLDFAESPRTLRLITDRLRRAAGSRGVHVVDLPLVFEEWLGGQIPDSRLFLDYCHMSSQGIRVGMAAIAQRLAGLFGSRLYLADAVLAAMTPSPVDEAHARLAAAVHNAHWGQPATMVAHHCEEAIRTSPDIVPVLAQYAQMQAHRIYGWLWSGNTGCMSNPALSRYVLQCATGPTAWQKIFDGVLVGSMVAVLESAGTCGIRDAIDAVYEQDYAVQPGEKVNLLESVQSPSWCHLRWFPNQAHAYYRSYGSLSRFVLVCARSEDVTLALTVRRPPILAIALCDLVVNGSHMRRITLSQQWTTVTVNVAAQNWRAGVNAIHLAWTAQLGPVDEARHRAVGLLDAEVFPDLMLPYGEVHSFTAHRSLMPS